LSSDIPRDLIYASFFFIDIVGLSNPVLSTETQRTKIKVLNELIGNCETLVKSSKDDLLVLPTGDGMLIGFKNGVEQPLKLSIEFHKKLADYNKDATSLEKIETRIGCHVGHVFIVNDILGNVNLWGPGAIFARRIMDMGDANHILVSNELVEDLLEISQDYKKIVHLLHNFGIKHGDNLLIYSAYGENFGNSSIPNEKIKIKTQVLDDEKKFTCEKMAFDIILKDSPGMARFERTYYFSNKTLDPIYEIVANVTTTSKEELNEMNLKIHDENNKELEISKILASTPYSKKIVIKLSRPVFTGDSERTLKIVYDAKLAKNYFENIFTTDTEVFELNFKHYANLKFTPKLYYIDSEQGSREDVEIDSVRTKGMFSETMWTKSQGIKTKDGIRLMW